ncbi:universal stress protein [Marinococcus luteus]|uniref:universal stress protein n=1 Tax=Marinococcus luteus TaxID=1122204 RepID=UPI002ACCBBC2|nr:universal stress protein [Marinococcus luteus]MDZ5782016.1 universal stress protein [Marinococcus luteus]
MKQYNHILAALDVLSNPNVDAFDEACRVAVKHDADLTLAYVFHYNEYSSLGWMDPIGIRRLYAEAEYRLEAYRKRGEEKGVPRVKTVLDNGVPKKRLVNQLCEKVDPDLIIVGQSGGNALGQAIQGNTTTKTVLKHAPCDVHVVDPAIASIQRAHTAPLQ